MPEKFEYDGVTYSLPVKRGLMFQSLAANYQLVVRPETPIWDHGVRIGTTRELIAEFGNPNAPTYHDPDTGDDVVLTQGHFCQTAEQAKRKGWTPDEQALVEKRLLAEQVPGLHWLHAEPVAAKPWPRYDVTPEDEIPVLAASLGLIPEANAYEAQNENRKSVLDALSKIEAPEDLVIEAV